jgi:hypothetical protein
MDAENWLRGLKGEDVSSTGESSADTKKADPDVASKAARGTL